MKKIITSLIMKNRIKTLEMFWNIYIIINKKYKKEVWEDENGNTLMHYVGITHSKDLLDFAKDKPKNINKLNKKGKSPIHCFMERSFEVITREKQYKILILKLLAKVFKNYHEKYLKEIQKKEIYSISYNKDVLKGLIENGCDINQLAENKEKKELGWNTVEYGSFSKKDHMGSAIEILTYYFWEYLLEDELKKENFTIIKEYEEYFETLTNLGANINTIYLSKEENVPIIKDELNDIDEDIGIPGKSAGIFFSRFIAQSSDYFALRPYIINKTINFTETDLLGNTILHMLFSRISARKHYISDSCCEIIIRDILENKQLTIDALKIKNKYKVTPIDLLRDEASGYKKIFENYILHEEFKRDIEIKEDKKTEKKKINKI